MVITNVNVARGAAVFFGGVGLYCVVAGMGYAYYDLMGPGPGFFPIWIGGLLTALSVALLVQSFRPVTAEAEPSDATHSLPGEPFFGSSAAARRVASLVLALLVVCLLLDVLGFRLTIFAFALIAPRLIEPQPLLRSVVVALLCGFGVAYGFETWLQVQLPSPSIGVLDDLGF